MKKSWYPAIILLTLILILFSTRLILPTQIDDISPQIPCEEKWMQLADTYYIIPKFNNIPIEKEWCDEILKQNKILALHGVNHTYKEFATPRNEEYLNEGIKIFKECFDTEPKSFKPPQLTLASENNWIKNKMEIDLIWNQIFHKVYHCNNTGVFPNWFVKIF